MLGFKLNHVSKRGPSTIRAIMGHVRVIGISAVGESRLNKHCGVNLHNRHNWSEIRIAIFSFYMPNARSHIGNPKPSPDLTLTPLATFLRKKAVRGVKFQSGQPIAKDIRPHRRSVISMNFFMHSRALATCFRILSLHSSVTSSN